MNGDCLVVMYHYVRDSDGSEFPGIRALTPDFFDLQLDWLEEHYEVIDVARLEAALNGGPPLPPAAALLTFDDGFVDHYQTVFPRLRARGLGGAFFPSQDACGDSPRLLGVHKAHFLLARLGAEAFGRAVLQACGTVGALPQPVRTVFGPDRWEAADDRAVKHLVNHELAFDDADRVLDHLFAEHIGDAAAFAKQLYLTAPMVKEMAANGMTFGQHTRTHRMLSRLSAREQDEELRGGVSWIRHLTGQQTVPFCYPWGGPQTYTTETVRILRESGYSLAFNTVRRRIAVSADGRYELPRFDTRDLPPYSAGEPTGGGPAPDEDA